jgi:hypothetical protein
MTLATDHSSLVIYYEDIEVDEMLDKRIKK